ncbi:MAG: 2-phospho-L-lactate guanylyltransferase [Nitrososphaerota archaeon]|nr:2-phospho-L-lactate guanylyltransferase [Nitrososphaerota archaeon]
MVIPVKSSGGKSRLSGFLSQPQRDEFSRVLLEDVLDTVVEAGLAESCFVVSSDRGVLELAESRGALGVLEEGDSGVNAAVEAGARASGADTVLVLPSDLPLLTSADVGAIIGLWGGGAEVVIAPSVAFDGTNALLYPAAAGLCLSYDRNSFWNHLASAASSGLSVGVSTRPGIMLDIDSPDDFRGLASSGSDRRAARFSRRAVG